MPEGKVYCNGCKHLDFCFCTAVRREYDTPFCRVVSTDSNPYTMNKNNDCKLFQQREEKPQQPLGPLDRFFLFIFG